ncbi:zinc ribbon domain-containing protein [Streptomyces sp. OZ13]|uniref:zinc ribbon domain-containing protein n=1 Tax=Streptomyces sp. OZ13 TaxID=3452210 RepID=UPI003F8A1D06
MASYCPHCGTPFPDEARFCMKCGKERLPEVPSAPAGSAAPPVPAAPPAPSAPAAPPTPSAPAAPPAPAVPPPPLYGPGPVQPSPVGAFLGRAMRGDWLSAAKAAAWPSGLLLVLAIGLAIPTYGQDDEVFVGWSERLRIALALLLQGVGGGFELKAAGASPYGPDGSGSGSGFGSDGSYGSDMDELAQGTATLSLVPLTVTALLIAALWLGARTLRRRGEGLEAAVRVSLLLTAVVLVLGLFAQPEIMGVQVSSSPVLAALGALVISLVVTAGVLQRDQLAAVLAQRPAARSAVRALGTAVGVVGAVVALCSLVGFVVYARTDDVDGTALLLALPILPNIGFAVLGLSWGVPVEYSFRGRVGWGDSAVERGNIGLGEISDEWGGGAVAGVLVLGVVCALAIGLWTARRSADRREQVLAGGFTLALLLMFTGVSGVTTDLAGALGYFGGMGRTEVAPSVPDALLFGLLWVGGALLIGPVLLRLTGGGPAPLGPGPAPQPPVWPTPGQPPMGHTPPPYGSGPAPGPAPHPAGPAGVDPAGLPGPAGPAPEPGPAAPAGATPHAAGPVEATPHHVAPEGATPHAAAPVGPAPEPGPAAPVPTPTAVDGGAAAHVPAPYVPQPQPPGAYDEPAADGGGKRRVLVWTATLTAAFVIGGGATAGVLMLQDGDDPADPSIEIVGTPDGDAKGSTSPSPTPPPPAASTTPATTPSPSATGPSPSADPVLPAGFVLKHDPAGFTVGVMEGWSRRQAGSQVFYEAPTGGDYIQIGIVRNTPMSSYDNFTGLEQKHLAKAGSDYERLRLEENTYQGRPGAIWEFTHVPEPDESDLRRHVIDQAFVAADGTEYAILAAGRADTWDPAEDVVFSTAISTFKVG